MVTIAKHDLRRTRISWVARKTRNIVRVSKAARPRRRAGDFFVIFVLRKATLNEIAQFGGKNALLPLVVNRRAKAVQLPLVHTIARHNLLQARVVRKTGYGVRIPKAARPRRAIDICFIIVDRKAI